jgi:hypothetical protein
MWVHFETFQVIWQPTYASMYQPAQGLVLAGGQVIAGHPFWGVWASVGAMCAAICWMLQAWLPPQWALLGGLLAVIRIGTFSYWANSYFGGTVAAAGGALVLGALPRIRERQRPRDAALMGIGLAILANSRPYEGLVFSLPIAVTLVAWMLGKNRTALRVSVGRIVVPLTLVLAVTAAGMGYYFWRVTGSPFHFPCQVDRETYAVAPYFLWQNPRSQPAYHHEVMRDFYMGGEICRYAFTRSLPDLSALAAATMVKLWLFYLGPLLTLPLVVTAAIVIIPPGFRWDQINRSTWFLLAVVGSSLAGLELEVFFTGPHYVAPMTCVTLALVLLSMRHLRAWEWRGKPAGLFMTRAVPFIALSLFALRASAVPLHVRLPGPFPAVPATWCSPVKADFGRERVLSGLNRKAGRHIVFVRYKPDHDSRCDWVYNGADIDKAKIVWARDMGTTENEKLIRYFSGRHLWLLEADEIPPRLSQYGVQ